MTDRKQREVEQTKITRRMEMALRAGGMAAWEWTPTKSYWTPELHDLLGVGRDVPVSTELFFSLVHPDDVEKLSREWQAATDGLSEFDSEFRIIRPDGQIRWVGGLGELVRDAAGIVTTIYGVNWDCTEQKTYEDELRGRQVKLQFITELQSELDMQTDEIGISKISCRLVSQHFGLARCALVEFLQDDTLTVFHEDRQPDKASVLGAFANSDFIKPDELAQLRAGTPIVITDTQQPPRTPEESANYARFDSIACVTVPNSVDTRLKYALAVCKDHAHQWSVDEVQLFEEVTSLVFLRLERSRACARVGGHETSVRFDYVGGKGRGVEFRYGQWQLPMR